MEKSLAKNPFFVQNDETGLHTTFGRPVCLLQTFSYFGSLLSSLDSSTRVQIFSCVTNTVIRVLWSRFHVKGFAILASGLVLCEVFLILLLIRCSLCSSLRSNGKPNLFQTVMIDTRISSVYIA
jgi:hypothetical protein